MDNPIGKYILLYFNFSVVISSGLATDENDCKTFDRWEKMQLNDTRLEELGKTEGIKNELYCEERIKKWR